MKTGYDEWEESEGISPSSPEAYYAEKAWNDSRAAISLPDKCPEKTVGPNPFRSNYAVGWDDCRAEMAKRIGVEP